MILWPAVLKYDGDAELAFIGSQAEWETDAALHRFWFKATDVLIDSAGLCYSLSEQSSGLTIPKPKDVISLDAIIDLVRAHASQSGACCVSKFSAASIREAILAVEDLQ